MTDLDILVRLLLALGFGAILGLETETRATKDNPRPGSRLAGVRTYTVLSLFGAIGGLLFNAGFEDFFLVMFIAVTILVSAAYVLNVVYQKAFGMTSEVAILITLLIGFAATSSMIPIQILLVVIVVMTFIPSQKKGVANLTKEIAHEELSDVAKFAIIVLVISPFLPNHDYTLTEISNLTSIFRTFNLTAGDIGSVVIINPFRMWQFVLLISGFNLAGYFANRLFGNTKGLLLTGFFGGFLSSTTTTIALAIKSIEKKKAVRYLSYHLGSAGLIANAVSFLQIMVLSASASLLFFSGILSISIGMAMASIAVALWYLKMSSKEPKEIVDLDYQPFSLLPALKFALLLISIRLVLQLANIFLGNSAFIVLTALSGIIGMDIATISLGDMVYHEEITIEIAVLTFVLANVCNFAAKVFYAKAQGSRDYYIVILRGLLLAALVGSAIALLGLLS